MPVAKTANPELAAKLKAFSPEERKRVELLASKLRALSVGDRARAQVLLGKYRRAQTTQWENDQLAQWGLIDLAPPEPPSPGVIGAATLAPTGSQADLAAALSRHFAGRITIDISEAAVSGWKKGRGLGASIPLPPSRIGNRFDTAAWALWMERHILPLHRRTTAAAAGPDGEDIFQKADKAEAQKKIDESAIKAIERAVVEGKYQSVETYVRGLKEIGALINLRLLRVERTLQDRLEKMPGVNGEQSQEWSAEIVDAIRNDLAEVLRAAAARTAPVPAE